MEFRLTYAGELLAHKDARRMRGRAHHVHSIRRAFHRQIAELWRRHPMLRSIDPIKDPHFLVFEENGFKWVPFVTRDNGLICRLEVIMLRSGPPGDALTDIDNRLKTVFDALRKADNPDELGSRTSPIVPGEDETPFFTLLEDDRLITHVSVATDTLLETIDNVSPENAIRMMIRVAIRPYRVHMDNIDFV